MTIKHLHLKLHKIVGKKNTIVDAVCGIPNPIYRAGAHSAVTLAAGSSQLFPSLKKWPSSNGTPLPERLCPLIKHLSASDLLILRVKNIKNCEDSEIYLTYKLRI